MVVYRRQSAADRLLTRVHRYNKGGWSQNQRPEQLPVEPRSEQNVKNILPNHQQIAQVDNLNSPTPFV
jgi:hypothetical protein